MSWVVPEEKYNWRSQLYNCTLGGLVTIATQCILSQKALEKHHLMVIKIVKQELLPLGISAYLKFQSK